MNYKKYDFGNLLGCSVVWLAMATAFYFQVHKYPLNFDAVVYAPLGWRLGKYLIVLGLCLTVVVVRFCKLFPLRVFDFLWLSVFGMAAICGIVSRSSDLVECGFWPIASWVIARTCGPISMKGLCRWSMVALVLNVLMVVIQAVGLIYFGKLFASANPNFWLSRFSGLTVEPLSATMLALFFVGFGFAFNGWMRGFIIGLGIFFLIACHTWTGYVYLLLLIIGISIQNLKHHPKWITSLLIIGVSLVSYILGSHKVDLDALYEMKLPSIKLHMTYWWPNVWRILPSSGYEFKETWWVNGVENMGIIWTVAYHLTLFYVLFEVWKKYKEYCATERAWIYLTTLIMGGYFLFGSFNLPYPAIYPANFIFFLFVMLCYFDRFSTSAAPNPAALNE